MVDESCEIHAHHLDHRDDLSIGIIMQVDVGEACLLATMEDHLSIWGLADEWFVLPGAVLGHLEMFLEHEQGHCTCDASFIEPKG
jgi:hypothetical protein